MSTVEPKPRPLTLEAHVLAYLGDYMTMLEESVKRVAQQELKAEPFKKAESTPGDLKCTASARNPS
jgi:hypothetical protein